MILIGMDRRANNYVRHLCAKKRRRYERITRWVECLFREYLMEIEG